LTRPCSLEYAGFGVVGRKNEQVDRRERRAGGEEGDATLLLSGQPWVAGDGNCMRASQATQIETPRFSALSVCSDRYETDEDVWRIQQGSRDRSCRRLIRKQVKAFVPAVIASW
jgi:hypothetical protein